MLNKKLLLTITFVLLGGFIFYKLIAKGKKGKNKMTEIKKNFTISDFASALTDLKTKGFKYPELSILEKMYRNETAHFTSNQYRKTGTGGMETKNGENIPFPYGWGSLLAFKEKFNIEPVGCLPFVDNQTKKQRYFIVFDSVFDAALFKIWFIEKYRAGKWENWNSLNPVIAANYKKAVLALKSVLANKLFNKC
jgi:hypothetical protein